MVRVVKRVGHLCFSGKFLYFFTVADARAVLDTPLHRNSRRKSCEFQVLWCWCANKKIKLKETIHFKKMFNVHLTRRNQATLQLIFLSFFFLSTLFWIFHLRKKIEDDRLSNETFHLENILNHCNIEKPNTKQVTVKHLFLTRIISNSFLLCGKVNDLILF